MMPYSAYKPTGLPWLPQIPEHWGINRAKNLYYKANRPVAENAEVITCFRDGQVTLRKNRRTNGFTESIKEIGYQGIAKGDLVIHVMDAFAGAVGVSDSDGKGTPVYSVCVAKGEQTNSFYYALVVREMAKRGFIQSLYRGIRERSSDFRYEVFAAQYLPVPPPDEQAQIVRYLDSMTAKINKLIRAKKKQIALKIEQLNIFLFSEDTSCLSLGLWEKSFPSSWRTEKASRLFCERKTKGISDRDLLAVTQKDGILYKKDCPQHFVQPSDLTTQKLVCRHDFVISLRSFQGGIEFSFLEGLVSAAYSVFFMRNYSELLTTYYQYLFKTPLFISYLNTSVRDIRDGKKISFDDFKESVLPIPPIEHLEKIKKLSDEISVLNGQLKKSIDFWSEYRTSMISSVVTGQVDVRSIPVDDFDPADLVTESEDDPEEEDTVHESEA